ncbi:MAG: ABC transporter ATP-binding protein [Roseovarius sp.]|nr:ABC transporter ATP-binding protein [Roseovarius sp.]
MANEVGVLKGAHLEVAAGETVALVGPSGAGKSTLLQIAGLLDTPDTGRIAIGGNDMTGASDRKRTIARRREVGFVYQFHHLLPEFTALENITLPQYANGVARCSAKRRARELLDRVGLSEREQHQPADMSGGEQQRVAFCRALANKPDILLADEPTGNLDPANSNQVFEALKGLVQDEGLAAVIATHNMDMAAKMDRIVKLENGRVLASEI